MVVQHNMIKTSLLNHDCVEIRQTECQRFVRTAISPTNEDHRSVLHLGDTEHA